MNIKKIICALFGHPVKTRETDSTLWYTYYETKCSCGKKHRKHRWLNG